MKSVERSTIAVYPRGGARVFQCLLSAIQEMMGQQQCQDLEIIQTLEGMTGGTHKKNMTLIFNGFFNGVFYGERGRDTQAEGYRLSQTPPHRSL